MTQFANQYASRRILLTGHTGFKGSWLALWLTKLGAQVTGLALPPETSPNHWELLGLSIEERRLDIRDCKEVHRVLAETQPELVFHLAAQPLVRRSYLDPLETWSTNVMGTANLLEACRQTASLRAIVVVTSDKCYENCESQQGYRESDRLGGHDPYSASKAATELLAASYRSSFFHGHNEPLLATARAGNVIGGGDWSEDRLIPDMVRAFASRTHLEIRSPEATRPWQHVLESLSGYLLLGQKLLEGQRHLAEGWNFGPDTASNRSVAQLLTQMHLYWPEIAWQTSAQPKPHEAGLLHLDSSKAQDFLGWRPIWGLEETLAATAGWYKEYYASGKVESCSQLDRYTSAARAAGAAWAIA